MRFKLAEPGKIRGDQLVDELKQATGLDLSERAAMYPDEPETVAIQVDDLDLETVIKIRDTVLVHTPSATYFPQEQESVATWAIIRTHALSAVGVALKDLTPAQVRSLLALVLRKMGAFDRAGVVKPLDDWAK